MPSLQSIMTKVRPGRAASYVRRIVRWYMAPSGLLLAGALALMMVASLGVGPSRVFAFVGVALMAVFLPYRFSRQQGLALDRASAVEALSLRVQQETATNVVALGQTQSQSLSGLSREVSDARDMGRVGTERLGRVVDILQARSALVEQRLDGLSDRDFVAAELMTSWSDQVAGLQQEIAGLQQEIAEMRNHFAGRAKEVVEIRDRIDEIIPALGMKVSALSEKIEATTQRVNAELVESRPATHALDAVLSREGLSGATTASGFQQFDRLLSDQDRVELSTWRSNLGLNVSDRALSYMAHEVRVTEDALLGRMAGSLGSAVLRALVLRSVDSRSPHVLEIGSLFGISIAALERSAFGVFDNLTFTAIDPLDGYYKTAELDILSGVPVSQPVFDENMRRAGIDQSRINLVRHLSTDEAAIQAIEDSSVDMLFIDGDHTRYGVECDFRNYVAKVRPTGYIVFDDYQAKAWPDVQEFVDEVVMPRDDLIFIGAGWETAVFRVVAR